MNIKKLNYIDYLFIALLIWVLIIIFINLLMNNQEIIIDDNENYKLEYCQFKGYSYYDLYDNTCFNKSNNSIILNIQDYKLFKLIKSESDLMNKKENLIKS